MVIKVDNEKCIGCGTCVAIAPDVFRLAADGKVEVYSTNYAGQEDLLNQAKEACPVQAISGE